MAQPCNDMLESIADLVQGRLPAGRIDNVRGHLDACPACKEWYDALLADARLIADYVASQQEAVLRIEAAVIDRINESKTHSDFRRFTMPSDFLKVGLAAAVIVIAAVIGRGYIIQGRQQKAPVATTPGQTSPQQAASEPSTWPAPVGTPETDQTVHADPVALAAGPGTAPLPLELPKPMFEGTPGNIDVPNLQKPLGRERPPFYAPAGCVNLAAAKRVTSSDDILFETELDMVTDGDKEGGNYIELGPFLQHVTIDLEQDCKIYAVLVWHYHKQARVYSDVIVQVADDPNFLSNVRIIFNNDLDNSAGFGTGKDMHYVETHEGKLIDAKGVTARYVRLYSSGNNESDLNNYVEIEVWGRPAKEPSASSGEDESVESATVPHCHSAPVLPAVCFTSGPLSHAIHGRFRFCAPAMIASAIRTSSAICQSNIPTHAKSAPLSKAYLNPSRG